MQRDMPRQGWLLIAALCLALGLKAGSVGAGEVDDMISQHAAALRQNYKSFDAHVGLANAYRLKYVETGKTDPWWLHLSLTSAVDARQINPEHDRPDLLMAMAFNLKVIFLTKIEILPISRRSAKHQHPSATEGAA